MASLRYDFGPQAAAFDPATLLGMLADGIRAHPVPSQESFDEARQRLAAALRVDAAVLVVGARAMAPERSPASRALLANLIEGYYREGDAEARVEAVPQGKLFDLLGEVLDAQHTWTKAAFAH